MVHGPNFMVHVVFKDWGHVKIHSPLAQGRQEWAEALAAEGLLQDIASKSMRALKARLSELQRLRTALSAS